MTLLSIERGVNWQANNSFTSKGCKSATIGVSQLHFCRDLGIFYLCIDAVLCDSEATCDWSEPALTSMDEKGNTVMDNLA